MELWKDIKGYEGLYQISNEGRVKSLERIEPCKYGRKWRVRKERFLKNCNGLSFYLSKEGKVKSFAIYPAVLEYFGVDLRPVADRIKMKDLKNIKPEKHHKTYTTREIEVLKDMTISNIDAALILERTYDAVSQARVHLRKNKKMGVFIKWERKIKVKI